jgi:hypothetical protein
MSDERDAPAAGLRADELVFSLSPQETTTVVRRGGPSRTRLLLLAIVAVMAVGVGALVTRGSEDVDPEEALAGAQAAFQGDDAYRLTATLTAHTAEPEDDEDADMGTRTEAVIVSPERWRSLDSEFSGGDDYETSERRRVDDELFVIERGSGASTWNVLGLSPPPETAEELAGQLEEFQEADYDDDEEGQRSLVLAFYAHVLPIAFDPGQVERLVLQATEPVVEEELGGGAVRLSVQVAPLPEIAAVAEEPVEPMALTLELDEARRPQEARFHLAAEGDTLTLDLEFSDWGAPLTVEPPAEDDVDRTPWVDEAALGDVDPALFVLPAEVPDGLELISVEIDEEEGEDDQDCSTVDVEYLTREATESQLEDYELPDGASLALTITHLACEDHREFDDRVGGRPATTEAVGAGFAAVRFGDVVVELDGSLDAAEMDDVARSLEQVTPEELLTRFPDWLPEVLQARFG